MLGGKNRQLSCGDSVWYRDVLHGKWIPGTVSGTEGSKVLLIDSELDGVKQQVRKHLDHVVMRFGNAGLVCKEPISPGREQVEKCVPEIVRDNMSKNIEFEPNQSAQMHEPPVVVASEPRVDMQNPPVRPSRQCRVPDRLGYKKLGG